MLLMDVKYCVVFYTLLMASLNHINIVTEKEMLSTPIQRLIPLLLYRYYIEDDEEPCTHHLEIEPAIYHVSIKSAYCIT